MATALPPARVAGKGVWAPCPDTKKYDFAMSSELADGLAVTAVMHANITLDGTRGVERATQEFAMGIARCQDQLRDGHMNFVSRSRAV